jgi:hypothetical protein
VPRYHFQIINDTGLTPDPDGQRLPNLHEARWQAIRGIRSILSDEVKQGVFDVTGRIEITDSDQKPLAVVRFSDAIELRLPDPYREPVPDTE